MPIIDRSSRCCTRLLDKIRSVLLSSPVGYRFVHGAFWTLAGSLVVRLLTAVASVIVARLLGKEGYGEVGMVQSTIGMFGIVSGFGLGGTATKYLAEFKLKDPEKAGRILTCAIIFSMVSGLFVMLIVLYLSDFLAVHTLNRPGLSLLLVEGSILLLMSTLSAVPAGVLAGLEAFKRSSYNNVIIGVLSPFIAIPCVLALGVQGAIVSYTITASIGVIIGALSIRKECKKYNIPIELRKTAFEEWPILWKFALPATISELLIGPVTWFTNALLANRPNGYAELGLFGAANQWRLVIMYIPSHLIVPMFPIITEKFGLQDKNDYNHTSLLLLNLIWVTALPLTVMVLVYEKALASIYGRQFVGVEHIMNILLPSCLLYIIGSAIGTIFAASGKMWFGTVQNLIWALAMALLAWFLIPAYGGLGLALSFLISYIINTVLGFCYLDIRVIPQLIKKLKKTILFTLLMVGSSMWIGPLHEPHHILNIAVIIISCVPLMRVVFYRTRGHFENNR